jgi:tRNA A-37 threonylcarbamoyl transferase component Bud32
MRAFVHKIRGLRALPACALALVAGLGAEAQEPAAAASPSRAEAAAVPAPPIDRDDSATLTIEQAVHLLDLAPAPTAVPPTQESVSGDFAPESEASALTPPVAPDPVVSPAPAPEASASETPPELALAPLTLEGARAALANPRGSWRALQPHLRRLARRLPGSARAAAAELRAGQLTPRARALAGGVLIVLLLALLVASRLARGRGSVVVCIEYPSELRGTFAVRLAKRSAGATRSSRVKNPDDAERIKRKSGSLEHMVSRETHFRDVRARRYFVIVDGFIQSATGDDIIAAHASESEVLVSPRDSSRVAFDFSPRACPVEIRVQWDKRPVPEARIARRGAPGSMRLARGPVQFTFDRGEHTLVVGSADRVVELPVQIDSFQPRQLIVDLANREHLLFSGCPPAVEPYLAGDISAAARALEREGQDTVSHVLRARFHQEQGQTERAAKHYETAGLRIEAAELRESLQQFEKAAALYDEAGEHARAAAMYRSAGKLLRAGDAYERADAFDSAVECFKNAGDTSRWIDALAKQGQCLEAGKIAIEHADPVRAIQCLNRVVGGDPGYSEAAMLLAEVYEQQDHTELAIHKLEELLASQAAGEAPIGAVDMLARVLEANGDYERALQALERLRNRDASYPNISTRIEGLRKRRSKVTNASLGEARSSGADVFSQEFRYEILEELGRGGMGIVFKARDRRLGRVVALKRLPDSLRDHPKAVELFLREARAAAALNHPNIVTLFDAGQEDGTFYITMELLEGSPLQKILKSRERLSASQVVKLGGQIATGLEYAHEEGIVHRDIKTANLFFTKKKIVKIMDFGLAKMTEEVRRATTIIGGTPYYMAPEQSAGARVDHRADLYALGVTFYELLTGRVPFREGDVAFHHRHTQPPDPRNFAPDLPAALAELVLELMAKRPEGRVQSAARVCERLQQVAETIA